MNVEKLRILLADDDDDDCYFFEKALKVIPIVSDITFVHDGEKLMNYLYENSQHLPDILFLDISMPRKTGLVCLSEIKQSKELKDLNVVMLSTSDSKDTISQVFKTGAHVYIHKPKDFAQLKQVIHHALPIATEMLFSDSPVNYILNA